MKKSHRVAHEKSEAWWVLLLSLYNFYCGRQDSFSKKEYKLPLIPFFVILSFIIFDLFHTNPFSSIISYFAIAGSNPYTSRIERSLDGSMLSISILYESYVIRSIMASARVLSSPQICWYHSLSRNCEQKIVDDFLRLLCISSKRFLASASVSLRRSHSSMISTTGLVCLRNQVPVFSQNKYLPASSSHADHFFYFIFLATQL